MEREIDLLEYHEHNAGRLVVDPEYVVILFFPRSSQVIDRASPIREARIEFGEAVARKLKLSKDGTKVLWPQPADDPEDPQNVRPRDLDLALSCFCFRR